MSDRKKHAAVRRDVRHTKDPNEVPKPVTRRKQKRQWCRGKVGVSHKPECRDYCATKHVRYDTRAPDKGDFAERMPALLYSSMQRWKILVCTECGKELAFFCPIREGTPPPAWVR